MYDRDLVIELCSQILEAAGRIERRFEPIKNPDQFLSSDDGIDRLDGIAMMLIVIGESIKNLDKVTEGALSVALGWPVRLNVIVAQPSATPTQTALPVLPSLTPTLEPTAEQPTSEPPTPEPPTRQPTVEPTLAPPTPEPTEVPPTLEPTIEPTVGPTEEPPTPTIPVPTLFS